MPPKDEENGCLAVPLDRISNLPENVLDDILMRVPLLDAVRTSILSRKWRFKWCRLPQLVLDEAFWVATPEGCEKEDSTPEGCEKEDSTPEGCEKEDSPSIQFTNIMYHLLTLHEGPVTKFTLQTYELIPSINNMIYFLSRNGIQHLVLRLSVASCALPSSFFACSQLRHLTLEGCSIQCHPPDFKGFAMLISMELNNVWISSENLGNLISQCPLLEQLLLHKILGDSRESFTFDYRGSDVIEINAPMLRSFDFSGGISSICLKNVPLLEKVSLEDINARGCDIAKFLESLSDLKHLQLNSMFLRPGAGGVPTRLPFDFHCVKHLCLSGFSWSMFCGPFDPLDTVPCVLCLLRSFPCLQYLELKFLVVDLSYDIPASISPEVLEPFSDMTFCYLREVKVSERFIGTKPAMPLLSFLLTKSPVLVRMLINLRSLTDESARVKILDGLSNIKPASPEAKVDFIF